MCIRKRILLLITNIYWLLNLIVLIVLTFFWRNPCVYELKRSNGIICKAFYSINKCMCSFMSIKTASDRLTWFGIITALWISGLTIIVFILGKTNDIIYGIKFSNIIIWQVSRIGIIGAGGIYTILLPCGFLACFYGRVWYIAIDLFFIFTWIIGASFFVIYYSGNRNTFKAIRCETLIRAKKFCESKVSLDKDYYVLANQLPLVKMIRCLEHNDSEETQRVKECLVDICNLFDEEKIAYQYFIIMPVISAYCEKAGFATRYDAANITDFFTTLLQQHWNEKCCLWIRAGIILPILEKWRGSCRGIEIVNILKSFPQSDRQRLVVILLLYIEYLRCCGDDGEEYFIALKRMNLQCIIDKYVVEGEEEKLYSFWVSWNLLDRQEKFRLDVLRNFMNDFKNWKSEEYAYQTWIMNRLIWEEWRT